MSNYICNIPAPYNEPILNYAPGSKERELLTQELEKQYNEVIEIPVIIGGKEIKTGNMAKAVMPTEHGHVLANYHQAGEKEIKMAIEASQKAKEAWENMPYTERASIFLKAAELISTKYRYILNAATMLNQSKSAFQAEIDSTCEIADFLRFNVKYMEDIYKQQPESSKGVWNRLEYRALEGFVFAVTPFNFTAIAGNLPTAPAMMGNTVLWKPASTAVHSGYYLMKLFKEAGLPDGVINFIPGRGSQVGRIVMESEHFAGVHFTGSTGVFNSMWKTIGENMPKYRSYPRIVGETGGKDYIFMHNSADAKEVAVAALRGAFEYQGQKCSACSRMYIPESKWAEVKANLLELTADIKMGCVRDFKNFFNAVIDENSFDNTMNYIKMAEDSDQAEIIAGGKGDKSVGYFIEPTIIEAKDPYFVTMREEIFAPVLTVYVYEDDTIEQALNDLDKASTYALTGAIFSADRYVANELIERLRHTAGNFYINDKPTGAVVGQQPFGGARGSGTNDKAGSYLNLLRWCSPRTIKETFCPPKDYKYPFMG